MAVLGGPPPSRQKRKGARDDKGKKKGDPERKRGRYKKLYNILKPLFRSRPSQVGGTHGSRKEKGVSKKSRKRHGKKEQRAGSIIHSSEERKRNSFGFKGRRWGPEDELVHLERGGKLETTHRLCSLGLYRK